MRIFVEVFGVGLRFNRLYRSVGVDLIRMEFNRLYSSVSVKLSETQHVYMPGLLIARLLRLHQYFVATLKQSSALFVKIQWSAQED